MPVLHYATRGAERKGRSRFQKAQTIVASGS
jgi:hypothetical protein